MSWSHSAVTNYHPRPREDHGHGLHREGEGAARAAWEGDSLGTVGCKAIGLSKLLWAHLGSLNFRGNLR